MASPTHLPKIKSNSFFRYIFLFLGFLGISLVFYAFYLTNLQNSLAFSQIPVYTSESETDSYPAQIEFKSISMSQPVTEARIENGIWEVADTGASYLITSGKPGQKNNIVIYGHNKKAIFGPLIGRIKLGDTIEVTDKEGKKFSYEVKQVFTTSPDDIGAVSPTDFEVLTVYTCTGFMDSKRLVIKAYPNYTPTLPTPFFKS